MMDARMVASASSMDHLVRLFSILKKQKNNTKKTIYSSKHTHRIYNICV